MGLLFSEGGESFSSTYHLVLEDTYLKPLDACFVKASFLDCLEMTTTLFHCRTKFARGPRTSHMPAKGSDQHSLQMQVPSLSISAIDFE